MLAKLWLMLKESLNVQTALVGLTLGLLAYQLLKKKYKLPPGPFALPLVGNILSFRNGPLYKKFAEWSKTYNPAITVYFSVTRCVVLNNSNVVLEALVKKSGDFAGRPFAYSIHLSTEGSKDIAFADYGPVWKFHRRIAGKALRQYLSGSKLESKVETAVAKGIEQILKEKEAFDPLHHLSLIVTNLLCGMCFGHSYEMDDKEFQYFINTLDTAGDLVFSGFLEDIFPPLRLMPTKRFRDTVKLLLDFRAQIDVKLQEHKNTFDPENIRDYTDYLLLYQREETDKEMLADVYLRESVTDIFVAGIDTSRQTLKWTLVYMAILPDTQRRVQEELDSILDGRFPRISDRDQLPYTEAALHESMRMSPVAPLGLPHKTTKDTTIGEYDIPAGTMVMINHWALHHDPERWKHPDRFLPERFLDEDGKMAAKSDSWLPFSAGRRNCLGETVAKPELFLIFSALMQKFHVSLEPGFIPDLECKSLGMSNPPPKCNMLFKPRDQRA